MGGGRLTTPTLPLEKNLRGKIWGINTCSFFIAQFFNVELAYLNSVGNCKGVMQGQLIAAVYTLRTH